MAANVALDDRLLREARELGGHRTNKETVTKALQEYIDSRKQAAILELFYRVDFDAKHNFKHQRRRR